MLKNKLLKIVTRFVLVFFVILSIFALILIKSWPVFFGLVIGCIVSLIKFRFSFSFLSKLFTTSNGNNFKSGALIQFALYMFTLIFILAITLMINKLVFIGLFIGILSVPVTILILCIFAGFGVVDLETDS